MAHHRQHQLAKDSSFILYHMIKLIVTFTEKDATIHMCTWSARKVNRESYKIAWPPFKVLKIFAVPMHCQCDKRKVVCEGRGGGGEDKGIYGYISRNNRENDG